jgi:predicted CxxxxCH...CXXCH cytochrome family protein
MRLKHNTLETMKMKLTKRSAMIGLMISLLVIVTLLVGSLPVIAADSPMLHNSNRFPGTTKHGGAWGLPGTKYGEFACNTCHAKNTGNIKRVLKTFTAPNGVDQFPIEADPAPPVGGINFQDVREGSSDFGDDGRVDKTQSSNVCEGCHTYDAAQLVGVKFHGYDMSGPGDVGHYNKADCMTCHPHNQGFKPQACDSCHGYPPTDTSAGGPNGLANAPHATGSTTAGSHQKHAIDLGYACTNCHDNENMPQVSTVNSPLGDISIGFNNYGSTTGSYSGQLGLSYNDVLGTGGENCSNVYCHSTGQSADGTSATPSAYSTPSWSGAAACGTCHSDTDPATGAHTKHIADGATCATCHSGNTHVNRVIDVTSGTYTADGAPGNGYGSCSTASCHDQGRGGLTTTPLWGASVTDCSECHASAPATGGHTVHLGASIAGAVITCADCHDSFTDPSTETEPSVGHRDTNIDVTVGSYPTNKAKDSLFTNCSTASCHQTGQSTNDYTLTSNWGVDDVNCTQCHEASPTTGSHAKHIATTSDCVTCHTSAVINTSYNDAAHGDLNVDVAVGSYTANKALGAAEESCASISCHSDGLTAATGTSPVWGTAAGCAACHEETMTTGSHTIHLTDGATCNNCHLDAVEGSTAPTGIHADGNVDVYNSAIGDMGYTNVNGYTNATWTTCNAASCHDQGRGGLATSPAWGTATTDCTECHAGAAINTGSHAAHIADGATCVSCHDAATDPATETAPAAGHRDDNIDTLVAHGYTQDKAKDSAFETCATATCHNDGRNSGLTGTWGTTINNCAECHAEVPATGGHGAHVGVNFAGAAIDCNDCHLGAVQGTTEPTANHRDGSVNAAGYPVQANGSAFTTCTTASCHQTGQSTDDFVTTSNWDIDDANCTQCHDAVPATGSHATHVTTAGYDCSQCHTNATKDTSYNDANHGDVTIDVAVGNYITNRGDALYNSAFVSCDTIACHGDGLNAGGGNTPVWGATAGCAACHDTVNDGTGSHAIHLTYTGNSCVACHDNADVAGTAPGQHGDGNVDVYNSAALDLGYPADAAIGNTSWTTCSAASCHDDGRSANTTPNWGTPAADACAACHDAIPATGSHASHVADAAVACTDCHAGAVQSTTKPTVGHDNGSIDVTAAYTYNANPDLGGAFDTCSTASCHDDGRNSGLTQVWGTTLNNCSECHATAPTTGSHTTHLANYACATCHTGTTQGTTAGAGHRDGSITTAASTGLGAKLVGTAFTSCSTNNCHGSNSPTWGTDLSANDECTQCHGELVAGPATDAQKAPGGAGVDTNGDSLATDAQVGAHQIHLNPTMSKVVACVACHVVPAAITDAGHIDSALPAELTFSGLALGGLDGQAAVAPAGCATTYCHDGAASKNGWDGGTLAPTWTDTSFVSGAAADCDNCHGYPPPAAHPANSDCSVCHDVLNADDVTFTAAGKLTHVDGIVQASGGDSCTDCHNADIDGAKNGVHSSHTDTASYLAGKTVSGGNYGGAGWYTTTYVSGKPNFGCGECHPAAEGTGHPVAGLNIDLDPAGETPTGSRKAQNTDGPTNPILISGSSVTCNNIYCHSDAGATATYATTQDWYGGAVSGNCNDCHANGPSSGTHSNHIVGIHYETLYDTDGVGLMADSGAANAAHGDAATADTIGCQSCHNDTVAVEVNDQNSVCATCHDGGTATLQGNMTINTLGATHVNGTPDVVFDSFASFKSKAQVRDDITTVTELDSNWTRNGGYKAANSFDQAKVATPSYAGGSCSNVSCHNGINTPTWNTGFVGNCRACHTTLP